LLLLDSLGSMRGLIVGAVGLGRRVSLAASPETWRKGVLWYSMSGLPVPVMNKHVVKHGNFVSWTKPKTCNGMARCSRTEPPFSHGGGPLVMIIKRNILIENLQN